MGDDICGTVALDLIREHDGIESAEDRMSARGRVALAIAALSAVILRLPVVTSAQTPTFKCGTFRIFDSSRSGEWSDSAI